MVGLVVVLAADCLQVSGLAAEVQRSCAFCLCVVAQDRAPVLVPICRSCSRPAGTVVGL